MSASNVVETLFTRRKSRSSQNSTQKDSIESPTYEEHRIRVRFTLNFETSFGWEIKVTGSIPELNDWDPVGCPLLSTNKDVYPVWSSRNLNLSVYSFPFTFEYKYILFNESTNEYIWESAPSNRKVVCLSKCSSNYVFIVNDLQVANTLNELQVLDKTDFIQSLSRLDSFRTLDDQLQYLTELLTKEVISYNTLSLGSIAMLNMKKPIRNDFCSYIKFIDWCSKNLSVQFTKILLAAISPNHIWLTVNSKELDRKILDYQKACKDESNSFYLLNIIASLRMDLLDEYDLNEDVAGLLITDTYLEKREFKHLREAVDCFDENEYLKIVSIGMWMTELLYLHSLKPKQALTMIGQFEAIKIKENLRVLVDLLNELMNVIIEVYSEVYNSVNHQECEALAAMLQSEYEPLYSLIFHLISDFVIKAIPLLNKKLTEEEFICYNPGRYSGKVCVLSERSRIPSEDCILSALYIPEGFEVPANVKALVVSYIDSLYIPSLLEMKKKGVPVCLCVDSHVIEGNYTLNVTEEEYQFIKCM